MVEFPSGTVTFLFTDIEESTQLWERHPKAMQSALLQHDSLIQTSVEQRGGIVVKNTGDGFYAVFSSPYQGLQAAIDAQRHLLHEEWDPAINAIHVRMGLHTGTAESRAGGYFSRTVNRAARISSAAHGGQILLSSTTQSLAVDDLPAELSLLDTGEHQLKGLINRDHIYQLSAPDLPMDFPPLRTNETVRHNLPSQTTPFLGRERQRAAVTALLRRDDVRLVTLSGPGGTGKTRLSLAVAEDLVAAFADGAIFVELATVDDPALVIPEIAATLDVKRSPQRSTKEALAHYLRDRQMLLVLDNFEQVIAAGSQVAELLALSAGLKILVTSREILRVYGEHEYPVPPLELPTAERGMTLAVLAQSEAVALFHQRARAANPAFLLTEENVMTVVAICRRLDGLPLAVELAAARTRILTPDALLTRLEQRLQLLKGGPRDAPARQRTIRDTIDWSYNLLDEADRELFARLSIFVGGWSLAASEAVCGDETSLDVLDGLASLRDKSLVQQSIGVTGDTRFSMLETIREYAADRLEESSEKVKMIGRHIDYFAVLINKSIEYGIGQYSLGDAIARFLEEYGNLRAAMGRAHEGGDGYSIIRIGAARRFFWDYLPVDSQLEVMTWLKWAIAADDGSDPLLRARALSGLGHIITQLLPGSQLEARAYFEESLAIRREVGEPAQIMMALRGMAAHLADSGYYQEAQGYYEEALALARELNDPLIESATTGDLGYLLLGFGQVERAQDLTRQAIALTVKHGFDGQRAAYTESEARIALLRGDLERALELAEESARIFQQFGPSYYIAWGLNLIAEIAVRQGDLGKARTSLMESLNVLKEYHDNLSVLDALEVTAKLQLALHKGEEAAELLGAALVLREEADLPIAPVWQADHDRFLANLRENLDEKILEEALKRGEQNSWEEAVWLALGMLEAG